MSTGISLDELLTWDDEAARFWKARFDAQPALLALPCEVNDSGVVQEFVRHIWMAELRWAECVCGLPMTPRTELPTGPIGALFEMHERAMSIFGRLLTDATWDWEVVVELEYSWLPDELRRASRRKLAAHALLHSQRHWAQLTTLTRVAGSPTGYQGDLIFSLAIR